MKPIQILEYKDQHKQQIIELITTIRVEEFGMNRRCRFALLDTLNFQARPFYEKFGYQVQWTQENYPNEGCKFFMVKQLSTAS